MTLAIFELLLWAWWKALKGWNAIGDQVEILFVQCVDRHRGGVFVRVVKRANFENQLIEARAAREHMGAAVFAKFARDRGVQIGAGEGFWCSFSVAEAIVGDEHKVVWAAPRVVLAFAAVTLCFELGCACGGVGKCAAVAFSGACIGHVITSGMRSAGGVLRERWLVTRPSMMVMPTPGKLPSWMDSRMFLPGACCA